VRPSLSISTASNTKPKEDSKLRILTIFDKRTPMLNQNLVNNEVRTDRLQVDSGGSTIHPYLGTFTTVGCFPLGVAKTGTFTTNNGQTQAKNGKMVLGTGTLFTTELEVGDFLYNAGKLRRIKYIYSDVLAELEFAFPASLTDQNVVVPPRKHYKMITVKSTGTADAIVDEQNFAQGETIVEGGTPISYDVSTTNAGIEITASL